MLAALTVAVTAACAARTGDQERQDDQRTDVAAYDSRFADILPPRPGELDLTGVDPCADLLTEPQLRELRYDLGYARPPLPDHSDIHGGDDCTFSSTGGAGGVDRNFGTLVGISTTEGALTWVTDPHRAPDTRPDVVTVEKYSAIVLPHPKLPDDCLVVVDTAEGQYLEVAVSPAVGEDDSADPYCQEAARVAGMAIQTISAARRADPPGNHPHDSGFADTLPPRPGQYKPATKTLSERHTPTAEHCATGTVDAGRSE
ncbi:MAG: DUF3558 domain-containing protein [Actinophytocola sp.]|uniref:DUF3558 domain-containing protein n=1 Tax=Actinophytocola sp. TaxID=1872138 RepID=UPI003C71A9AD